MSTPLRPIAPGDAWLLLAAEPVARVDLPRWRHQARTFFGADVALVQTLTDPAGALPDTASFELDVARAGETAPVARVRVVTVPLAHAPDALAAARAAVAAIGGAGFEHLVPRATRLWQVAARTVAGGGDARAPLVVAALLASVLLAPVVPPEGGAIFGVKTARTRLAALGWT